MKLYTGTLSLKVVHVEYHDITVSEVSVSLTFITPKCQTMAITLMLYMY